MASGCGIFNHYVSDISDPDGYFVIFFFSRQNLGLKIEKKKMILAVRVIILLDARGKRK